MQLAAILLSILGTVTGIHLFIIVATIGCYVSLKHSTYSRVRNEKSLVTDSAEWCFSVYSASTRI